MDAGSGSEYTYSTLNAHVALDFCNTVDGWTQRTNAAGEPEFNVHNDYIRNYRDLVVWGRQMDVLTEDQAAALIAQARAEPAEAEATLTHARQVREALFRLFATREGGRDPRPEDVVILNDALARGLPHLRLAADGAAFGWGWDDSLALDRMLWPVARAAADLLTSPQVERVRACDGETCHWLFIDTSKNNRRRWCSMDDCGNRAKARRHYHRVHSQT